MTSHRGKPGKATKKMTSSGKNPLVWVAVGVAAAAVAGVGYIMLSSPPAQPEKKKEDKKPQPPQPQPQQPQQEAPPQPPQPREVPSASIAVALPSLTVQAPAAAAAPAPPAVVPVVTSSPLRVSNSVTALPRVIKVIKPAGPLSTGQNVVFFKNALLGYQGTNIKHIEVTFIIFFFFQSFINQIRKKLSLKIILMVCKHFLL